MRALAVEAERLLDDESPLVRGAAVWALSQLMGPEAFAALAARRRERMNGARNGAATQRHAACRERRSVLEMER